MKTILIVGSGITGCTAALECVRHGYRVIVAEKECRIGGKVVSYCCKAADTCLQCGVCVAHDIIAEAVEHPRITFMTGASVKEVTRKGKTVTARIGQMFPAVALNRCTDCGACIEACPAGCITEYSRGGVVFYSITRESCLVQQGKTCTRCADACPESAIVCRTDGAVTEIKAEAVIVAAGHSTYDAALRPRLGWPGLTGVFTGEEAEEILSARPYLVNPEGEDIAFIQCVGSRDPEKGMNYCSSVCCAYAARMGRMLKHNNSENSVAIYYIDLQNFDKTFSVFRRGLEEEGIRLFRGVPFSVRRNGKGKLIPEAENRDADTDGYDAIVLSTGIRPPDDAEHLCELFGLQRDEFGFLQSGTDHVLTAGTCAEPQSILDSIASAKQAAARIIARGSLKKTKKKTRRRPESGSGMNIRLEKNAAVIGGNAAGILVSRQLRSFGYPTTLIEESGEVEADTVCPESGDTGIEGFLSGIDVRTGTAVERITGHAGSFEVALKLPSGTEKHTYGALVVCSAGAPRIMPDSTGYPDAVVSLKDLDKAMSQFTDRKRPRSAAIILDMERDETKAGMDFALRCALILRRDYRCEVYIFCRDVRVNSLTLEKLYDRAREALVAVIAYDGDIEFAAEEVGISVTAHDTLLDRTVTVPCGIAGISRCGLSGTGSRFTKADSAGTDAYGQLQENNIHLFPGMTNCPGIFVAGECRGTYYTRDIIREAEAAALDVHSFLSQDCISAEPGTPVVDSEKCVLCLTCVRSCPHSAMVIDTQQHAAAPLPALCRRCGICAGECPAGAIEMPDAGE